MVLPTSQTDIACCRHYTRFGCISRLLGIFQVVSGVSLFWCIMFLYVYFSEEEADAELHGRRRSLSSPDRTFRRARRAIRLLIIVVAFAFAIMLISAVILNRFPWYSQEWANVLGVCVACFACVQWVPQVWTTIHLGHLGSLSLASICMGAPYTWIFGINMILRLGLSGWSVWIVYVLVGIMQLTLIVTAIIYMIRDNRKARRADATSATASNSSRRDVSESPSTRALRPQLDRWNSFAAANAEDGGNERTPLLAGRKIAEIIFTLCLTGAVWIHSSHITNNGTGLAQPSRRSKIWNTFILLSILGTGIAAWGLGLDPAESKQVFQSPFSYTTAVRDDQAVRIVYIVFRAVVIFASGSVSIEVLRKWINLKNNGKPGNPERPVLQRFTYVVVPLIWLRDVFIIMSIVMIFVSTDSWTKTSREALAFLLITFGQYANLIIVFMVLWGSWSMGNSLETS
ncbi:hypothetical protein D6D29_10605 [Aureobasidium pullulans]|nr:hypothetical protein D6D29_10605 [Aureobasidium pullulans]